MVKAVRDFLWQALRPWPGAAANLLTASSAAAVLILAVFKDAGRWPLVMAALLIALVYAVAAGARLQLRLGAGPRLVFAGVDNDKAHVVSRRTELPGAQALTASFATSVTVAHMAAEHDFVRVQVANDPDKRQGVRAERVVGRIAFLGDDDELLIPEIVGRWAETLQRMETGRAGINLDEAQLDIDANGLPHPLDIAMKAPEDDHFYAFNHENSLADGMRLPKHQIDASECRVRVTLQPANGGEVTGLFVLTNGGAGEGLKLEPA